MPLTRSRCPLERLLHRGEHDLIEGVGVGQQLVVVRLDDERDPVGVPARHHPEHAHGGGDGVTTALDGQFAQVRRVEVGRIRGERRGGRVLHPLVHRQDRQIPGTGQPAGVEDVLQVAQHGRAPVTAREYPVHETGSRQVQPVPGDRPALVARSDCVSDQGRSSRLSAAQATRCRRRRNRSAARTSC
jgi:hypothetical protein